MLHCTLTVTLVALYCYFKQHITTKKIQCHSYN